MAKNLIIEFPTLEEYRRVLAIEKETIGRGRLKKTQRERIFCSHCRNPYFPVYVYVFPFYTRGTGSYAFRDFPYGTFCYECYQRYREIIETATEVLELWNTARRLKDYAKERRDQTAG
jgi:hypothetical protein